MLSVVKRWLTAASFLARLVLVSFIYSIKEVGCYGKSTIEYGLLKKLDQTAASENLYIYSLI